MNDFKNYLQDRIDTYTKSYHSLKESEKENQGNEELSLAYSSQASAAWDTKCELEGVLREYDRSHQPAANVLADVHQMD